MNSNDETNIKPILLTKLSIDNIQDIGVNHDNIKSYSDTKFSDDYCKLPTNKLLIKPTDILHL
jgi:hypothetical protein